MIQIKLEIKMNLCLILSYYVYSLSEDFTCLEAICEDAFKFRLNLCSNLFGNIVTLSNGAKMTFSLRGNGDWYDVQVDDLDIETIRLVLAFINEVPSTRIAFWEDSVFSKW